MSRTYEIVCHDCRVRLWIGQASSPEHAYIYSTDMHLRQQRDFFFSHQRHRLEFGDDEQMRLFDYTSLDEEESCRPFRELNPSDCQCEHPKKADTQAWPDGKLYHLICRLPVAFPYDMLEDGEAEYRPEQPPVFKIDRAS